MQQPNADMTLTTTNQEQTHVLTSYLLDPSLVSSLGVFWDEFQKYCKERELEDKNLESTYESLVRRGGHGKTELARYQLDWSSPRALARVESF